MTFKKLYNYATWVAVCPPQLLDSKTLQLYLYYKCTYYCKCQLMINNVHCKVFAKI